jgi:hypothetical protein
VLEIASLFFALFFYYGAFFDGYFVDFEIFCEVPNSCQQYFQDKKVVILPPVITTGVRKRFHRLQK